MTKINFKNNLTKVLITWMMVFIIGMISGILRRYFKANSYYLIIYELVMLTSMYLLNKKVLKVKIYFSPTERSWRLIPINWLTIILFLQTLLLVIHPDENLLLEIAIFVFAGFTEEYTFRGLL
ncbi:hypothetical protein, partial [Bombilactobacillus bombi]|uniref:hypothetical protein n=1 Tax=Bombilactobacillus bombi TaxID=1303590 RepID=UPI0015E5EAE4